MPPSGGHRAKPRSKNVVCLLDKEDALFVPSGTQANLVALMTHCQRGDEYIVGQSAHCYRWEGGGAAVLGSIQPQPLTHQPDGSLALDEIIAAIKPDDAHFARTRLLTLENTIGGKVLSLEYLAGACTTARAYGLALHLDGARVFNAAVKLGVPVAQIAAPFDSVSCCLSKGLGAPIGSLLLGSTAFIAQARRWCKMLGGGMRQAGMLAAAGIYALDHHIERLVDDHVCAASLATGLATFPGLNVASVQTNMVFVTLDAAMGMALHEHLAVHGVAVTAMKMKQCTQLRWVTHSDVTQSDVDAALRVVADFCV